MNREIFNLLFKLLNYINCIFEAFITLQQFMYLKDVCFLDKIFIAKI